MKTLTQHLQEQIWNFTQDIAVIHDIPGFRKEAEIAILKAFEVWLTERLQVGNPNHNLTLTFLIEELKQK